MNAKRKSAPDTCIRQAELILQLYELRRETVMRFKRNLSGCRPVPRIKIPAQAKERSGWGTRPDRVPMIGLPGLERRETRGPRLLFSFSQFRFVCRLNFVRCKSTSRFRRAPCLCLGA